jgi:hypothetical protein
VFVLGYAGIIFEEFFAFNKAGVALLTAVGMWTVRAAAAPSEAVLNASLGECLADVSQVVFFLMGAMTVVETVDAHAGFKLVTDAIGTRDRKALLWLLGGLTFAMSAVLDNLTSTIVMVSLLRKLVKDPAQRKLLGAVVVIAANAGGAWTPIGDVTTTMLWINGQISTLATMRDIFLPAALSLIVPLALLSNEPEFAEPPPAALIARRSAGRRRARSPLAFADDSDDESPAQRSAPPRRRAASPEQEQAPAPHSAPPQRRLRKLGDLPPPPPPPVVVLLSSDSDEAAPRGRGSYDVVVLSDGGSDGLGEEEDEWDAAAKGGWGGGDSDSVSEPSEDGGARGAPAEEEDEGPVVLDGADSDEDFRDAPARRAAAPAAPAVPDWRRRLPNFLSVGDIERSGFSIGGEEVYIDYGNQFTGAGGGGARGGRRAAAAAASSEGRWRMVGGVRTFIKGSKKLTGRQAYKAWQEEGGGGAGRGGGSEEKE